MNWKYNKETDSIERTWKSFFFLIEKNTNKNYAEAFRISVFINGELIKRGFSNDMKDAKGRVDSFLFDLECCLFDKSI